MTFEEIIDEIEKRAEQLVYREDLPVHVVLIENEESGTVTYMRLSADGHLGALDA